MSIACRETPQTKPPAAHAIQVPAVRVTATVRNSARAAEAALCFGLPLPPSTSTILKPFEITCARGHIVLITAPSGGGKSTALAQIERSLPGSCPVDRVRFTPGGSVLDDIAPSASLGEAARILTACGLGEAPLWLRSYSQLSEGEKFRARLGRAIGHLIGRRASMPLICDEFCSGLHRRAARAICHNLRKLVSREGLCAILACASDDMVPDLQPDVIVRLSGRSETAVESCKPHLGKPFSLRRRLHITRGTKRDYEAFAAMHYKPTDELGFVTKVFLLRERPGGKILGIVVYAHPPLELSLRNRATRDRFRRHPRLLNRKVRILRRLVVHPDIRGCGLARYLVRRTLPLVGTEYVECLATMGAFNPVFEKAGMTRIGRYDVPPERLRALRRLEDLGVDPCGRDFPLHVARSRRVRDIVTAVVHEWYAATTAEGRDRVARQSFETLARIFRGIIASRPVYYLWHRRAKRGRSSLVGKTVRGARRADVGRRNERRDQSPDATHSRGRSMSDRRQSRITFQATALPPPPKGLPAFRPHNPRPSEVVARETGLSPAAGLYSPASDGCQISGATPRTPSGNFRLPPEPAA